MIAVTIYAVYRAPETRNRDMGVDVFPAPKASRIASRPGDDILANPSRKVVR
jgi:hypothetical protein